MQYFIVFSLFLFQVVTCAKIVQSDYDDAVAKVQAKVDETISSLKTIRTQKQKEIAATKKQFLADASTSYAEVRIEQVDLNKIIAEDLIKAKTEHKSIDKCVDDEKEALKDLDLAEILDCKYKGDNLVTAEAKLMEIDNAVYNLKDMVAQCIRESIGYVQKLEKCADKGLKKNGEIADKAVKFINSSIEDNKKIVGQCLKDAVVVKEGLIQKAEVNFVDCANKILD